MPRRKVPLVAGCYYHLYNRGHNKAEIFFEQENYSFFLRQLGEYVIPKHGCLIAYTLMPNHYHLLLEAQTDDLSHAMQLFTISYTKAINKRFQRTGALFQGAFQAKRVDRTEYLLHLSRYIHLNPVRAGLAQRHEDWFHCSYRDYVGLRKGGFLQPTVVLAQFQTSEVSETSEVCMTRYRTFVQDSMPSDRERIAELLFD